MSSKLGEVLLRQSLITQAQLDEAVGLQKRSGRTLDASLVELGFIKNEHIARALSVMYGMPFVDLKNSQIDLNAIKLVPGETAKRYRLVPVSRVGSVLKIAMADPTNVSAIDDIKFMTGFDVEPIVASESAIETAILNYYGHLDSSLKSSEKVGTEVETKANPERWKLVEAKELPLSYTSYTTSYMRENNYAVVKIFYATDRQPTEEETREEILFRETL